MWKSTVPAALAALVAMHQAAPALAGVEIIDGPPQEGSGASEGIAFGWNPNEDVDAVEATVGNLDLAGVPRDERYTIHASLTVINGGDGTPAGKTAALVAARERAGDLLAAVGDVLAADGTLRGTVTAAALNDCNWRQDDTDRGMLARVNFSLTVRAFIR